MILPASTSASASSVKPSALFFLFNPGGQGLFDYPTPRAFQSRGELVDFFWQAAAGHAR
jgi:hypothetical protein